MGSTHPLSMNIYSNTFENRYFVFSLAKPLLLKLFKSILGCGSSKKNDDKSEEDECDSCAKVTIARRISTPTCSKKWFLFRLHLSRKRERCYGTESNLKKSPLI